MQGGHQCSQGIRKEYFFAETADKAAGTLCYFFGCQDSFPEFLLHRLESDNWSGDQLGKHRHVGGKMKNVFLCFHLATVYIHVVADDLEAIEANPDREDDSRKRQRDAGGFVDTSDQEIGVFEKDKYGQSDCDKAAGDHFFTVSALFACVCDTPAAKVAGANGCKQQDAVFGLSPQIEEETCQKQDPVFSLCWHQIVYKQCERQEVI